MRILLVIFLASLCLNGIGQVTYFNNASTSPGVLEAYEDVIVRDSSYVLRGAFATDTSVYLIRTLDLEGNMLASKTIAPSQLGTYWIPPRCYTHTDDYQNYFMFSGADIGNGQQGFVIKMDANFDTLWTKYYDLDLDGGSFFNAGLIHDNHLILVGEFANFTGGDYSNRLRIVKLDLDGNLIWNKVVDEPLQWELTLPRFLEVTDSGYLVGAGRLWFTGSETEPTTHIRKTNFDGEVVWSFDGDFDTNNHGEFESGTLSHSSNRLFTTLNSSNKCNFWVKQ